MISRLPSILPIAVLLALWQLVCAAGWIAPNLLPSPLAIGTRLVEQMQTTDYLFDIGQTLFRLVAGFLLAVVVGVVLGLAMSQGAEPLLGPVVKLLAPVPKIALYPALVLVFGFGHASKIALVLADAAFPIMLATFHGARAVPPKLLWSAWAAGADRRATLFTVVLPSAFASILTGCRIGMTIACVNVFLAEMISSSDGLGHLLIVAARSYRTTDMFTPLVLIAVIGLSLTGLLQAVSRQYAREP